MAVERIDISITVIGFLDRTNNMSPIIEDENLASQIEAKMIEHGRPIITVEHG